MHNRIGWLDSPTYFLLDIVEEAAEFSSLPNYLTLAASTTLKIVNEGQNAKNNVANLRVLAQSAIAIVALLWRSSRIAESSDIWHQQTHQLIQELVTSLCGILELVEETKKGNIIFSIFKNHKSASQIKRYRNRLQSCMLKVASHPAIQDVLGCFTSPAPSPMSAPVVRKKVKVKTGHTFRQVFKMRPPSADDSAQARVAEQLERWTEKEVEEVGIKRRKEALWLREERRLRKDKIGPNLVESYEEETERQYAGPSRLREGIEDQVKAIPTSSRTAFTKQRQPRIEVLNNEEPKPKPKLLERQSGYENDGSKGESEGSPDGSLNVIPHGAGRSQGPPEYAEDRELWRAGMSPAGGAYFPPPSPASSVVHLIYPVGYLQTTSIIALPASASVSVPSFFTAPPMQLSPLMVAGGMYPAAVPISVDQSSGGGPIATTSYGSVDDRGNVRSARKREWLYHSVQPLAGTR
ncbi:unnamed protein product [Cyclocybe aegerita]|uniref:Uncharacterized protein n=1 Tax=Cyclocybe aegerita TaxID=1973307 RepID=A0A8S0WG81_CYCAE|nr:unnamed protein product [Cyclocybe aegerita]